MLIALLELGTALLVVAASLLVILTLVFLGEVAASFLRSPKAVPPQVAPDNGIAILVPAHNEALVIEATLRSLLPELSPGDRLIVIADNCSDQTGAIAERAGAEVIYRNDLEHRGKGYALDYGVRHLAAGDTRPDVVIVNDADCAPDPGTIGALACHAVTLQRPVQARYDLDAPVSRQSNSYLTVASLAWSVKNYIRPLGLHNLGLPCQLMGTGMAFPWNAISRANLKTGNIVEDMALGLELADAGTPPNFLPSARVTSRFPVSQEGQETQRARWERGHLGIIVQQVPGLLLRGFSRANLNLIVLAIDAAIPPLTFLLFSIAATFLSGCALAFLGGSLLPLGLAVFAGGAFVSAVLLAAWQVGKGTIFLNILGRIPTYAISKLAIYVSAISGKPIGWIRSKRD
jgi:cellulose synthase/poly-beta-1,6-N-acetylglucosamine synthase-like glycosyltransferase